MTKLEVIGAGYGRTGTMSLKKALEILEFGPCYHMEEIWGKPDMAEKLTRWADICQSSDGKAAIELIASEGYRSSVDFPSSALSMDMYRIMIRFSMRLRDRSLFMLFKFDRVGRIIRFFIIIKRKSKLEGYSWSQRKRHCMVQLRLVFKIIMGISLGHTFPIVYKGSNRASYMGLAYHLPRIILKTILAKSTILLRVDNEQIEGIFDRFVHLHFYNVYAIS